MNFPAARFLALTFCATLVAVVVGAFIDPACNRLILRTAGHPGTSSGAPAYVDLEPPFVVMMSDQHDWRYLELRISVRVAGDDAVAAVTHHESAIEASLLNLLYGRDYRLLQAPGAMEAMRLECLREAQRLLLRETGAPTIEDLYFKEAFFQ